jgi:hypothetical protein
MIGKLKKIFFVGMFGVLYVSFIAQLGYVLTMLYSNLEAALCALGLLSLEWLVIIAARYLSKKSASGREHGNNGRDGFYHRR